MKVDQLFRRFLYAGALAVVLPACFVASILADNEPVVHYDPPHLTVQADNVRLRSLLEKIAAATGINIVLSGPGDLVVSASFSKIAVEQVIARILNTTDAALIYKADPDGRSSGLTDVFVVLDDDPGPPYSVQAKEFRHEEDSTGTEAVEQNPAVTQWGGSLEMASISELEENLYGEQNPESRLAMIESMGSASGNQMESAAELLKAALKNSDPNVRTAALASLSTLPQEFAEAELLEALSDRSPEVRVAAFGIVGALSLITPVNLLDRGLKDTDVRVRTTAIETVANLGSAEALSLLAAASKDADSSVKKAALEAIAQLQSQAAADDLREDISIGESGS